MGQQEERNQAERLQGAIEECRRFQKDSRGRKGLHRATRGLQKSTEKYRCCRLEQGTLGDCRGLWEVRGMFLAHLQEMLASLFVSSSGGSSWVSFLTMGKSERSREA